MNTSTILAIESSCDETACAIVQKNSGEDLAKVVASTTATSLVKHKATKGIVPEVAAREQLKYILPVIEETLKDHRDLKFDAIAVTVGPGLVGSLLVGIETARSLAMAWNLQLIPVNHIQAHPYANFIKVEEATNNPPQFPLLSWVISGGHTDLYLMNSHEDVQHLGGTVDDAAGECFDKCARVLGFDYPGGPFIEKLANEYERGSETIRPLPRPLLYEKTFNMSFSGLKTAFLRSFNANKDTIDLETLKGLHATELQEAVSDIICKRTEQALEQHPQIHSVIVSGGVAANKRIREKLADTLSQGLTQPILYFPPLSLCTDNAAMIGAYAAFHLENKTNWENVKLNLK